MKRHAIIVAGGSGQRMKSPVPKQFLELNHKPVLMHTIESSMAASSIHIVVVLPNRITVFGLPFVINTNLTFHTKYVKAGQPGFSQ